MHSENARMCSWVSLFFPENNRLSKEKKLIGMVQLLCNLTKETIDCLNRREFHLFDAYIGNNGCEAHTFRLLHAVQSLTYNSRELETRSLYILDYLEDLEKNKKVKQIVFKELFKFYQNHVEKAQIPDSLGYLIQSRLLTVIKEMTRDRQGYENEKKNENLVLKYSPRMDPQEISKIVSFVRQKMSEISIKFMGDNLDTLYTLQKREIQLLKTMFKTENLFWSITSSRGKNRVKSKLYSCAFYNIKALIANLAEKQLLLIFKRMTKVGEDSQPILYRANQTGGIFEPLSPESFSPSECVVVCEAFVKEGLDNNQLKLLIHEQGFLKICLASAAEEKSQYVPKRPELCQVKVQEAIEEIQSYKNLRISELCNIAHFSISTLGYEMKKSI